MVDVLYDLIGGKETVWAATESFYTKVFSDDTLRPFLKPRIWPNYARDKACFSPCFSEEEFPIPAEISMQPISSRGSRSKRRPFR